MTQVPSMDDWRALNQELQDMKVRVQRLETRPTFEYVTVTLAAQTLGMTTTHVRRLCNEGVLKTRKDGKRVMVDVSSLTDKALKGKGKSNKAIQPLPPVKAFSQKGRPRKTQPPAAA